MKYVFTTEFKDKWIKWRIPSKFGIRGENIMPIDPKMVLVKSYEYLPYYDFFCQKTFFGFYNSVILGSRKIFHSNVPPPHPKKK